MFCVKTRHRRADAVIRKIVFAKHFRVSHILLDHCNVVFVACRELSTSAHGEQPSNEDLLGWKALDTALALTAVMDMASKPRNTGKIHIVK